METALLLALGLLAGIAIAGLIVFVARTRKPAQDPAAELAAMQIAADQAAAVQATEQRVTELGGHVSALVSMLINAHSQLQSTVDKRLDSVTQHLHTSLNTAKKETTDNLQKLNERLAVIDHAQKNITELASQVTSLQSVLSNKQLRGVFGQGRMEAIVQDKLPKGSYEFQYTLKN